MGAINYCKNEEFVTLGYDFRLIDSDDEQMFCEDEYEQVKDMLSKFHSDTIKVSVESGYYEGFWIKVSLDVNWFDNYQEKKQAMKDVSELKKILLAIIDDFSVLAVDCWWVSTWYTKDETRKKIRKSASELRKIIKSMFTDKTLRKQKYVDFSTR